MSSLGLQIENIVKRFGSFTAVNHLSLDIPDNEMFGLLGGNGAGKTTTFRMILGLLSPTSGYISWQNQAINYHTSRIVGYLPEERGLYPKLKVQEQLVYLGRLRGMEKKEILNELDYWLEKFKVPENKNKKVDDLSKGNQQKIQFIAAVIHKPKLLILDEPFSGLDPVNVEILKNAVIELKNQGTTILFSSHRMEHVEELCENLCILHKGKAIVEGSLKDVKRSFGKKNVSIHAEFSLDSLKDFPGVTKFQKVSEGVRLQVTNESVAKDIFAVSSSKGFLRKFELEEPSLNDIFVEKVGGNIE